MHVGFMLQWTPLDQFVYVSRLHGIVSTAQNEDEDESEVETLFGVDGPLQLRGRV